MLIEGDYRATVYYTCPQEDLGTVLKLSCGDAFITKKVTIANDPPLVGEESDRTAEVTRKTLFDGSGCDSFDINGAGASALEILN